MRRLAEDTRAAAFLSKELGTTKERDPKREGSSDKREQEDRSVSPLPSLAERRKVVDEMIGIGGGRCFGGWVGLSRRL